MLYVKLGVYLSIFFVGEKGAETLSKKILEL